MATARPYGGILQELGIAITNLVAALDLATDSQHGVPVPAPPAVRHRLDREDGQGGLPGMERIQEERGRVKVATSRVKSAYTALLKRGEDLADLVREQELRTVRAVDAHAADVRKGDTDGGT